MRYELTDLQTFLAVLDHGTVTAAAARLNVAKSVVSKRIGNLETALGAALFRRNAGRITPTEAAQRLAERLRPVLADLAAAAESAAWGMDGVAPLRGTLRIAAPMSFGTLYLGPIIARFAAANPELEIIADYDDRARDLPREGFDIGIRIGEARDSALKARKLCEDRIICCASPDYLAAYGTPTTPVDLARHQVIGYSHVPNAQMWQFRQGDRMIAAPVHSRLSLNNGEAMRDMAEAALGIAMLPGFIAARSLHEGRLVPVLADYGTRPLPIAAIWPPVEPMPPKLRRFVDHLVGELDGGKPWQGA
ncbi:MAG: LysR family transcriptional regulator [Paracoccus sp. (in: a-proteobacteria)]|uniref:LysR family transcriptional regulator n=1 Tax=Paracoccus sp. TaxID=267 RepID=UPI0026DF1DAB|nr:LysR family transcriptional regulator [Paracoccus sp. (in: a-proteobacteria)]MDO5631021.1 LysR family transcriptional regulator [Paracoccus sp. (in: a-proteobacteria)]